MSLEQTRVSATPIASTNVSVVRAASVRSAPLTLENIFSMGIWSGLHGGAGSTGDSGGYGDAIAGDAASAGARRPSAADPGADRRSPAGAGTAAAAAAGRLRNDPGYR